MARYSQPSAMRQELLAEFCEALLNIKNTTEALQFLGDLLTKSEVIMLAKRIHVAKMLIEGQDYRTIQKTLQVSHSTIAKVASWLEESGEGFRLVAQRSKKEKAALTRSPETEEWRRTKRRYPLMFWPQLLLEDIVRNANKRQKEQLRSAIEKMDHKSKFYKEISAILHEKRKTKQTSAAT